LPTSGFWPPSSLIKSPKASTSTNLFPETPDNSLFFTASTPAFSTHPVTVAIDSPYG